MSFPRFYLAESDFNEFDALQFEKEQNAKVADEWQNQMMSLVADASQASASTLPAPSPVQEAPAAPSIPTPSESPPVQSSAMPATAPVLDLSRPAQIAPTAPLPSPSAPTPPARASVAAASPSGTLVDYARQAAQRAGIDPELFVRQIQQESGFNPNAQSPAGAIGIAQIVPKFHPNVDATNPTASLDYAANLMASHLKTYGGDIRKALVAYNGGGGAVNALVAGTPYQESQQYLDKILGSGGQTAASAPGSATSSLSLSQFGDKTLTAEEAYSACGPTAARRLALIYGNAIPADVALKAAKEAGWTPQGGMNGIANEKKLMDALGLPAELDTSGSWDRIISEVGAGKFVTISTPGHYFTAAPDPSTGRGVDAQGRLYVGQSGLDLKGGKAWMTPSEIEGVMGKLNGALISDPGRDIMAGDWAQKVATQQGVPLESPDQTLAEIGQARQRVTRPDETLSNPFGEAMRQVGDVAGQVGGAVSATAAKVQNPQTGNPVVDAAGTAVSAIGTGIHAALSPFGGASEEFPTGGPLVGPAVGGLREAAGYQQMGAEGATEAERQLTDLLNRRDNGEQGLDSQIQHWTQVYDQATGSDVYAAAQRNPNIGTYETIGGVAQAVAAAPLAGEGMPLAAKVAAAAIDPQTGLPAVAGRAVEAAGPLIRSRQRAQLDLNLITGGGKPTNVEQILDSGLIIPGEAPPSGPSQILGPRGELLSTVASREGPPSPGVGVIRSAAGAEAINEPSRAVAARMPNIAKMAPDMPEVQATIQRIAEDNPQLMDAFRQGTITHQQLVNDLAPRLGMTAQDFLKSKVGQAFNPEELLALRAAVVSKQADTVKLAQDIATKGGVEALSAEDKVRAVEQIVDAARLQAVGRGGASTAGRALNQQKIVISQEMARAVTGGNEKIAAQKALNAARAKQAWAEKKLADLGEPGAPKPPSARQEVLDAWKKIGQESKAAAAERDAPVLSAYDDAISAARADLSATQNYLSDTFDAEMTRLDKEASARMSKAGAAQGEGQVAWLKAQAKAAQQEVNAVNNRAARAWDESLRVRERQQEQAARLLDKLGGQEVTDQVLKEFIKAQNSGDPLAAAQFLRGLQHVGMWDRVSILRYASMLSATTTHLVNAFGNTINVGLDVGLKPAAVGIDVVRARLTGGERSRYLGEIGPQLEGLMDGAVTGMREGLVSLKTGINPRDVGKLENVRGGFQSGNRVVDTVVEAPLRALTFSDNVFRGASYGGHVRSLAARRGIQEGYSGAALRNRIQEIVENLPEFPAIMDEANKLAARSVLQEPNSIASSFSRIGSGPGSVNMAQRIVREIVVPFAKTPLNIMGQGLEMTPLGLFKAKDLAKAGDVGGATDTGARVAFGSAVMVGTGALAANGFVTAGYPADPKERETLPPGWQPWSLRLPDGEGGSRYIEFSKLGPLAIPMAIGAIAGQSIREHAAGGPMLITDPGTIVGSLGKFMIDQTFLQGLSTIMDAVKDPKRFGENATEQLVTSFVPYAALSREVTRVLGMADRDPKGAIEALAALTPITAGSVPRRQDALGRDVQSEQTGVGAVISPLRYNRSHPEPVMNAFRNVGMGIPSAPSEIRIPDAMTGDLSPPMALNQREQNDYQRLFGEKLQQQLGPMIADPSWARRTPEGQKTALEQKVKAARAYAEGQVYAKMTPDDRRKRMADGRIKLRTIKPSPAP